jgi:DNA repair protein RadC
MSAFLKRTADGKYRVPEVKLHVLRESIVDNPELRDPGNVYQFWNENIPNAAWYDRDREMMVAFFLSIRCRFLGFHFISSGTLDSVVVHPREIFRAAILQGASGIILAHNHPSGETTPSEADIRVTRDLIRAGQLLKIEVLDHVIIGESGVRNPKGYSSLRELGYFYTS